MCFSEGYGKLFLLNAKQVTRMNETPFTNIYAALLHDLGSIILEEQVSVEEIESNAQEYAHIGAKMIRDLPGFAEIADVIELCQTDWATLSAWADGNGSACLRCVRDAAVIHLGDAVSTCLNPNRRILSQVPRICSFLRQGSGTAFMPEALDALDRLRDLEVIWLDAANNPGFLMFFTGEFHQITLQKTAELTRLMSRIIDYRSAFTAMHSAGVAATSRELARLCGWSAEDCSRQARGAALYSGEARQAHGRGVQRHPGAYLLYPPHPHGYRGL